MDNNCKLGYVILLISALFIVFFEITYEIFYVYIVIVLAVLGSFHFGVSYGIQEERQRIFKILKKEIINFKQLVKGGLSYDEMYDDLLKSIKDKLNKEEMIICRRCKKPMWQPKLLKTVWYCHDCKEKAELVYSKQDKVALRKLSKKEKVIK